MYLGWLDKNNFKNYLITVLMIIISAFITTKITQDKQKENEVFITKRIFPSLKIPIFIEKIIDNKGKYVRGTVNIIIYSEYIGKLKNGYFVNEISLPENNKINTFSETIPYMSQDGHRVTVYCDKTISNIETKKGISKGSKKSSCTWTWNIQYQNDLPLGKYTVKMMVFNEGDEIPGQTIEDSFVVNNEPSP